MIKVVCLQPLALLHKCQNCRALLYYNFEDIIDNKYITCPVCKTKQVQACDLSYDGVISNDSNDKKEG